MADTALSPTTASETGPGTANILAITGGKGGVGKTSIALNLAIALARLNNRVCLLDAATGLTNVSFLLGLDPGPTLEDYLSGEWELSEIVLDGPKNITILPGAGCISRCANLDTASQARLIQGLQSLETDCDWMLLDTTTGISSLTTRMIEAAQRIAVVITPEPSSLTKTFSLLQLLHRNGYRCPVLVIVNRVTKSEQPQSVFRRFRAALKKYIGLEAEYLGAVWTDESMGIAVSRQSPVATLPTEDPSCRLFMRLADSLISRFTRGESAPASLSEYCLQRSNSDLTVAGRQLTDHQKAPTQETQEAVHPQNSNQQHSDPRPENVDYESLLQQVRERQLSGDQIYTLCSAILVGTNKGTMDEEQIADLLNTLEGYLPQNPDTVKNADGTTSQPQDTPTTQHAVPEKQPSGAEPRRGHYDIERFGGQEQLIDEIRALREHESLDEFLRNRGGNDR